MGVAKGHQRHQKPRSDKVLRELEVDVMEREGKLHYWLTLETLGSLPLEAQDVQAQEIAHPIFWTLHLTSNDVATTEVAFEWGLIPTHLQ